MKKLLSMLAIIGLSVALLGCTTAEPEVNEPEISEEESTILNSFSFTDTEESSSYNIFGEAEFDTVVTGYLKPMETESFGGTITSAYFSITDFEDEVFRESLMEGIENGNAVNRQEDGHYLLNLGCLEEDNTITGYNFGEDEPYLDDETEQAIIVSTAEEPITVTLHFGYHLGSGCTCCNLAHNIRLVEA